MPAFSLTGQVPLPRLPGECQWFATPAGQVLLSSQLPMIVQALGARPGVPWLWLSPCLPEAALVEGRGVRLVPTVEGCWSGDVRCAARLPLPSEVFANIVVQHALSLEHARQMLPELVRLLIPGGHLWLFALNPISPWRWHWRGSGLHAVEPFRWRRSLRLVGLIPDDTSRGIGPVWRRVVDELPQTSAGLRAAYVLYAEKRHRPLNPIRSPQRVRLHQEWPAT